MIYIAVILRFLRFFWYQACEAWMRMKDVKPKKLLETSNFALGGILRVPARPGGILRVTPLQAHSSPVICCRRTANSRCDRDTVTVTVCSTAAVTA